MELALLEDRLEEGARLSLPAGHRVLYVVNGTVDVDGVTLAENHARHHAAACVGAGARGRTALAMGAARRGFQAARVAAQRS